MSFNARNLSADVILGLTGIVFFLLFWEIIGHYRLLGLTWPAFSDVLQYLLDSGRRQLFLRALSASLYAVSVGYFIGLFLGITAATLAHLSASIKPGLDNFSAFVHAIPSIALAPLFIVFLGRSQTPIALSCLNTFFIMYVTTTSSFAASKHEWKDLLRVVGASRWQQLTILDLPAAIPIVSGGMRLAAPSALIGTIIGEWFGSTRGLGVLIINAMQNFQIPLLWSAVVVTATVSIVLFISLGVLQAYAAKRFR
jgi:NitT/TauT family transport system permease protein